MPRIDETLRKIAGATSRANSESTSSTEANGRSSSLPGDPNCPICHGIGFVRQDLPLDHPDFGRLQICSCRQKEASQAVYQKLYRLSNLDAFTHMTFESFNTQPHVGIGAQQLISLTSALNHATQFAKSLKGWLLLMGGYGTGKTHLAAGVANFAVSLGVPTLFLTVPDLLDWLRFSYDSPESNFEERFEEIRNIKLLVLDDLGTQNATPWAEEKLFQILNYRYVNKLPTVLTTNQKLGEIEGRVRSRLEDPELVTKVEIRAPDYRSPVHDTGHPQFSSLEHHSGRTFGTFWLREHEKMPPDKQKSLETAFRAAQEFAENPRGWLVLNGDYGTGKTHLAAAIGNYQHSLGATPVFVVVPELLDHLRATFSPSSHVSYDDLFEEVKNAQLLILDDLGTESATPWAREKLYQIFNYRYNLQLPTVITTSRKIEELDPRIRSRMLDSRLCDIYAILADPFRGVSNPKIRRSTRKTTTQR